MQKWILSIIIVCFLITLVSLILPQGKTSKCVKNILSLIMVVVIIQPLLNVKNANFSIDELFFGKEIILQTDFLDYISDEKIKQLEIGCVEILEGFGVVGGIVSINYVSDDGKYNISNVIINLKNSEYNSQEDHIFIIDKARKSISEYLSVDINNLVIYE